MRSSKPDAPSFDSRGATFRAPPGTWCRRFLTAAIALLTLLVMPSGHPVRAAEQLRASYLSFAVGYEPSADIASTSLGPSDVAAGDLNGDGRPDLAVVLRDGPGIEGGSRLAILFDDANPSLPMMTAPTFYATGRGPARVAMADLDTDGDLDVVTADGAQDSITVFLNQGSGTLKRAGRAGIGAEPLGLILADLNGDARPDAVIATGNGVKVLLASGVAGSFAAPVTYSPTGSVQSAAVGDVDANGIPDLVAGTSSPNTLAVFYGAGNGTFTPGSAPPIGYAPSGLALADMTGDGTLDAVVISSAFAQLTVHPSDQGSPFSYASIYIGMPYGPMDLVLGDFDADGDVDVAVAMSTTSGFGTGEALMSSGDGKFANIRQFDFGPWLDAIAAGDFNGDGRTDLAACGAGQIADGLFQRAVNVALQPGTGPSGTFGIGATYRAIASGTSVCGITAVDMNRDGTDDIVVAGVQTQASVTIRPGSGSGTWGIGVAYTVPGDLQPLVVPGDFNRDGKPDLVVTSRYSAGSPLTQTYLGNGDWTVTLLGTWSANAEAMACGDLARDGRLDLVLVDPATYQVLIQRGHGDGTFFNVYTSAPLGEKAIGATVGDLNRDGKLDVVISTVSRQEVFLGNGDGTLQASSSYTGGGVAPVLADLDEDGILDLLAPYPRHGNGDGTFGPPVPLHPSAIDLGPAGPVVPLDTNRDGHMDLVYDVMEGSLASHVLDSRVDVWLGNGAMGFGARTGYGVGRHALGLAPVDANRDGRGDVIAVDRDASGGGTPWILTLLGNGPETFFFPTSRPVSAAISRPWAVAVADFTRDGIPDAVVGRNDDSGDYTTLLVGNGDGTFSAGASNPIPSEVSALAIDDLNRDGIPDVAITCGAGDAVLVQLGTADGTLSAPATVAMGLGYEFNDIAIGDFNRDGRPDLAAASSSTYTILILPGNGDGTFAAPLAASTGSSGPTSIAVGDTNRDGIPDLVAALGVGISPNSVGVLLGRGDGTFQTGRPYPCGASPYALALADLNRDGVLDVAVTRTGVVGDRYVAVLLGQAGGGFASPVAYPITGNAFDVIVVDIDGEGIPDLIASNGYGYDTIAVLHGLGSGVFAANTDHFMGGSPVALASADFSRDGRPDILGGLTAETNVAVLVSAPSAISSVAAEPADAPRAPRLAVRPNPASGSATVSFELPAPGRARVELYDVRGRRVARLFEGLARGPVSVRWNGALEGGGRAAAGVYFARLTAADAAATRRIVWMH